MKFTDFSRFFRWIIKPTKESKHPTNIELDELKDRLMWYLPASIYLFKRIIVEQIKWFFKHQWKSLTIKFLLVTSIIFGSYFFVIWLQDFVNYHAGKVKVVETNKVIYVNKLRSFDQFVYDVAWQESRCNMSVVNRFGYMGYFQFGPDIIKNHLGFNISNEDFLSDSTIQLAAFKRHIKLFKRNYKKYIDEWNGKTITINGDEVTITTSGIFMAFHSKPEDAKLYFDSNCTNTGTGDGNGRKVNENVKKYSGYNLP